MTEIRLRDFDPKQLRQLQELAAREGQPVETYISSLLADVLRHQSADREKGLGTRIAKRFEGLGFEDGEIEELRGQAVEPPEFGQ